MFSIRPLSFKVNSAANATPPGTVSSPDSSHGSRHSSGTSASDDAPSGQSPTEQSLEQRFHSAFHSALEEQWQSEAYSLSGTQTQPAEAHSDLRTAPPENARKLAKTSCLMGVVDRLELGFYSSRPRSGAYFPSTHPEAVAPRRGRLNRLLSRLTFKSNDQRLGNFHRVDRWLLRGAMPESAADFAHLRQQYGVNTILDLRGWETSPPALIDYERHQAHQHNMRYLHLPMDSRTPPHEGQLRLFFRLMKKSRQRGETVYVHCKQGVDRTGALIAAYRVATGHSQPEAFREMRRYGYNWRHSLTRPAQRTFVLSPTLPDLLKKAQWGADLQREAQTLRDKGALSPKIDREVGINLAQGQATDGQKRLDLAL